MKQYRLIELSTLTLSNIAIFLFGAFAGIRAVEILTYRGALACLIVGILLLAGCLVWKALRR